ncbi:MAG: HAMP domain-containing protein [Rubrivivax sp.]|nr:MAG: HAMP domain-containing protein [Rubrivivax sp.]
MSSIRDSIALRVSMQGCAALLIVLSTITAFLTIVTTQRTHQQRVEWAQDRARGVASAIDGIDLTSRTMVGRVFPVLSSMLGKAFKLNEATSELSVDEVLLNGNFDAVDRFATQTGGVATIFAKNGDGFKRIATSVKKEDGTRALGTMLDPRGLAFASLKKGQAYVGRATLFGKPYMTKYDVIRDAANHVVGVLFVGFEVATFDEAVEEVVQHSRFFDTGGIYLIDPKAALQDAVFAAHPTANKKKVLEAFPAAGQFLEALASSKDKAVSSPGLLSKAGNDRWAVMSLSASTGQWVVAELSEGEAMQAHWQALVPFWAMLGLACLGLSGGLLWLMHRQVGQPLSQLSQAATAVAAGTLTQGFTSDRHDEIGQVIRSVDAMRLRFLSLLTTLRRSAESISTASSEIAAGNNDLSSRTEQSAASLEETASSMEQLTSTVKQTAESAGAARTLANSTSAAAQRGTLAMQAVEGTMGEISASARQISDIISVIDGIAFQTNILALNAAVEAARAGEQGRGFAVVAGEVRSLAQRSAGAAKEIKTLISGSVEKVQSGTQLVASAGMAMNDIQTEVSRVNEIIGQISHAAAEQADGIAQVNEGVGQLDRSTQQNAALVEESAAAAQSLNAQAMTLSAVLQEFQISASANHG